MSSPGTDAPGVSAGRDGESPKGDAHRAAPRYPESWVTDVVLRDGRTVHMRPIGPDDQEALLAFHERQSPESVYFRFLSPRPRLSHKDLRYFTEIDYHNRVAFVAEVDAEIVAVARYERYSDSDTAEVAFFVDDRHHGRGLATVMLEYLAAAARHRGIRRFTASTLPNNRKMLNVFARAGYDVKSRIEDGLVALSFSIAPTDASTAAADGRERVAAAATVERLLCPQSVAVVARSRESGLGAAVARAVRRGGFTGELSLVARDGAPGPADADAGADAGTGADVGSGGEPEPVVSDEVPEGTDLAIVAVRAELVPSVVADCARAGVGAIMIMSSGFGTEAERRPLEHEIVLTARRHGVRLLGPDCFGILNTDPAVSLRATVAPVLPAAGSVAMLAESGTLAAAILEESARREMGVSTFVAGGGHLDVGLGDMLSFWGEDAATDAVLLYLRSTDLRPRMLRSARAVSLSKPVAVLGELLVGPDGDRDLIRHRIAALERQTGVISVGTLEQLMDIGRILADQPVPAGRGVAVVGNSEGAVALAAAACNGAGLLLGSNGAPGAVTLSFRATARDYEEAIDDVCADDSVSSVLVVHSPPRLERSEEVSRVVAQRSAAHPGKCFVAAMLGVAEAPRVAEGDEQVPVFAFAEHPARALGRLARYREWVDANRGVDFDKGEGHDQSRVGEVVRRALEGVADDTPVPLDLAAQEALLDAYGVSVAERVVVANPDEAVAAAERIGWPVALKAARRDRRTRSAISGVAIDLADAIDLRQTWARMQGALGADMHPVVVQRFIERGVDAAISIRRTRSATTIHVGLGGPVTAMDTPEVGYLPLTLTDAQSLVASSALGRALSDPLDRVALVGVVQRLASLVERTEEITSLVADPVVASVGGAWVADVRVEVALPAEDLGVRHLD